MPSVPQKNVSSADSSRSSKSQFQRFKAGQRFKKTFSKRKKCKVSRIGEVGNHASSTNINLITDICKYRPNYSGKKFAGFTASPNAGVLGARDLENLRKSYDCIILYLKCHGFDVEHNKSVTTYLHWTRCASECGWIKFIKYKLAAFMATYLGNQLPECPFQTPDRPDYLVGSHAGKFIKKVVSFRTPEAYAFAYGLLQIKKGLPRPDKSALEQAVLDTFEILTTKQEVPKVNFLGSEITIDDMKFYIDRVVQSFFKDCSPLSMEEILTPHAPSLSGNYTRTRGGAGTYGHLRKSGLLDPLDPNEFDLKSYFNIIKSYDENGKNSQSLVVSDKLDYLVKARYEDCYGKALDAVKNEEVRVQLVPLAEPLKVRVISKGPPLRYFLLKPIQKKLHDHLRKKRQFRLIGEPCRPEYIYDMFKCEQGDFYSIDYKSATDLLNPDLSLHCVKSLCKILQIPSPLDKFFEEALTGHQLIEPTIENDDIIRNSCGSRADECTVKPQLWGQLMGSIVSFPILCIINAALLTASKELGYRRAYGAINLHCINPSDLNFFVNGDDALIRTNDHEYHSLNSLVPLCGFKLSIGKAYRHSVYININSTSYLFNDKCVIECPYINMGLLLGMVRSEGQSVLKPSEFVQKKCQSLGTASQELLRPFIDPLLRQRILRSFIKQNWKVMSQGGIPWFLPQLLGGIGIASLLDFSSLPYKYVEKDGFRYGPSDYDLLKARYILNPLWCKERKFPIITNGGFNARATWMNLANFQPTSSYVSLRDIPTDDSDVLSNYLDTASYFLVDLQRDKDKATAILNQVRDRHRLLDKWISKTRSARTGFTYLEPIIRVMDGVICSQRGDEVMNGRVYDGLSLLDY